MRYTLFYDKKEKMLSRFPYCSNKTVFLFLCYTIEINRNQKGKKMAFGISRTQLMEWKEKASNGEIAFLTHYWLDDRFPNCTTVTKVACSNRQALIEWGRQYGLKQEWIHQRDVYPHFDLVGTVQKDVLWKEGQIDQLHRLLKGKDEINEDSATNRNV